MRHLLDEPLTLRRSPVEAGNRRGDAGFIDKDKPLRVKPRLPLLQGLTCGGDVRPILLGGAQAFLRNGDAGRWVYGLEHKAEGLRSTMQVVNHPRAVSGLVGRRAWVYVFHAVLHGVVEQDRDLAR